MKRFNILNITAGLSNWYFGTTGQAVAQPQENNQLLAQENKQPLALGQFFGDICVSADILQYLLQIIHLQNEQNISTFDFRELRRVNKAFLYAWEKASKFYHFNLTPALHELTLEGRYDSLQQKEKDLLQKQQEEIIYLITNKAEILRLNNNQALFSWFSGRTEIVKSFENLERLQHTDTYVSFLEREKYLNAINVIIAKKGIMDAIQKKKKEEESETFEKESYTLYLNNRYLTRLPNELFSEFSDDFASFSTIIIANNYLTTLPDYIGQCTSLKLLCAFNNKLTELPATLEQCTNLWGLSIYDNKLTTLPANMASLKVLNVDNNNLTELTALKQCSKLERLFASKNNLSILPEWITKWKLTDLDITENNLSALPEGLNENILYKDPETRIDKAECLKLQNISQIENKLS